MTHLILHKVRGEPAFDIAGQMEVGDESWWIVSTSGHRAYPYRTWKLSDICARDDHMYRSVTNFMDPVPDNWPDHYEVSGSPPKPNFNIMSIISPMMTKIKRRL